MMLEQFLQQGIELTISASELIRRFSQIKAIISDWDGVFNNGIKTPGEPSPFAEADALGTNMFRFSFWQRNKQMPLFGIITGADNPAALYLAEREHFQAVYSKVLDKGQALQHFCSTFQIGSHQVACFFDDANDLSMAKMAGLRVLFRRNANFLFTRFVKENQLCDLVTSREGGAYAVREICEMLMTLNGNLEEVYTLRMNFDEQYQTYFKQRQEVPVKIFHLEKGSYTEKTKTEPEQV